MIHRQAILGHWGVNRNSGLDGIIIHVGDSSGDQCRAVLSVEQAGEMIREIQRQIDFLKAKEEVNES
jgi:hypothetical protein